MMGAALAAYRESGPIAERDSFKEQVFGGYKRNHRPGPGNLRLRSRTRRRTCAVARHFECRQQASGEALWIRAIIHTGIRVH